MSLSDEIQRLDELRRSGALSDDEFQSSRRRVLHEATTLAPGDEEATTLARLDRLDQRWNLAAHRYSCWGDNARRLPPSRARIVLNALYMLVAACILLSLAASTATLAAVVIIVVVGASSVVRWLNAEAYRDAKQAYKRQCREVLGGQM